MSHIFVKTHLGLLLGVGMFLPAYAKIAPAKTAVVVIDGFQFMPATVLLKKGGTVTFINQDSTPHTVTPDNPLGFAGTGRLAAQERKIVTFTTIGQQTYHCAIHPSMIGKVIVRK